MTAWMRYASCAESVGDIWFPETNSPNTKTAKAICNDCPVIDSCLNYALENRFNDGIWGGLTPNERKLLLRNPKRRVRNGKE